MLVGINIFYFIKKNILKENCLQQFLLKLQKSIQIFYVFLNKKMFHFIFVKID